MRLYGAASAHRAALGLQFSTTEQISYRKALDHLHQLVPPDDFAEHWHQGESLGFQAAIDFALDRTILRRLADDPKE